jgi:hypothetical protein
LKVEECASTVSAIEEAGKQGEAQSEIDHAWALWHRIQSNLNDHDKLSHEAKVRLSRFPIFRGTP